METFRSRLRGIVRSQLSHPNISIDTLVKRRILTSQQATALKRAGYKYRRDFDTDFGGWVDLVGLPGVGQSTLDALEWVGWS